VMEERGTEGAREIGLRRRVSPPFSFFPFLFSVFEVGFGSVRVRVCWFDVGRGFTAKTTMVDRLQLTFKFHRSLMIKLV
jgi:hypothetical protein